MPCSAVMHHQCSMMENVKVKRSSILMSIHTRNLYTIYNEVERNVSSLYRTKKKIVIHLCAC